MIITRFGESVWAVCVRGGKEHGHGGVEGLWAQRVSEWQTGWPFPTLRWQTLIRGNYKDPLARSDLILLRRWEPNVIMALGFAELGPSGNKPRSQAGTASLPTWVGVQGTWPKFFSETQSHLFPAASSPHHYHHHAKTFTLELCKVGFWPAVPLTESSFNSCNWVFCLCSASRAFWRIWLINVSAQTTPMDPPTSLLNKYPSLSTKKLPNVSSVLDL